MQSIVLSWMMILSAYTGTMTNYAEQMFTDTSHNFGVVAKGSPTEFDFVFTNKYKEDVEIQSVSSSCQCTTPSFKRGPIKSWEKGAVHISVNTKSFEGNKNATITVRFSKPFYAEVQLHSYVFIRSDVFVNPGIVYFGSVRSGDKPALAVNVSSTRGSNWVINDVQSSCKFLAVELKQTYRQYNNVGYQMTVRLKENAPAGPFSEYLELITNDADSRDSHIMVRVEGRIKASLAASPSPLSFGLIEEGSSAEKSLVLQGTDPFTIKDITSEDRNISASLQQNQQQKVQVVKLRYTADQPRAINGFITIFTDVEGSTETKVVYNGKIVPKPQEEKPEVKPAEQPADAAKPTEEKPAAPAEVTPPAAPAEAATPAAPAEAATPVAPTVEAPATDDPATVAPATAPMANLLPSDEVTDISNLTEVLPTEPAETTLPVETPAVPAPSAEVLPQDVLEPAAEAPAPVTDVPAPATDPLVPAANVPAPVADAQAPAANVPAPAADAQAPAANATAPVADAQAPAANATAPATSDVPSTPAESSIAVPTEQAPPAPAENAGSADDIGVDIPVETPKVKGRNLLRRR